MLATLSNKLYTYIDFLSYVFFISFYVLYLYITCEATVIFARLQACNIMYRKEKNNILARFLYELVALKREGQTIISQAACLVVCKYTLLLGNIIIIVICFEYNFTLVKQHR